jgi:cyclic dehypoxanthinyl futalosine synthase
MSCLRSVTEKVRDGARVTLEEALLLHEEADLLELGDLARWRRFAANPHRVVTYVVDRNINYTNVCLSRCRFCAFHRGPGDPDAYILDRGALAEKIHETLKLGGTQILLQGGLHPDLGLDEILEMLRWIRQHFSIHVHGFSPPEIVHMARGAGLPLEETLLRLKEAGLGSIPGGGAEILVDRVRKEISPRKCTADEWLEVMRVAHGLGIPSTATMMFGHVETVEERIRHLEAVRSLQDETGGFTAFIPWAFQPHHTRLGGTPATAVEYLRTLAVSRIFLDNIPHIQASWVTQGDKVAQVALEFGADDFGSTMIEENVVAAAGVRFRISRERMEQLIQDAGYTPRQRDTFYRWL